MRRLTVPALAVAACAALLSTAACGPAGGTKPAAAASAPAAPIAAPASAEPAPTAAATSSSSAATSAPPARPKPTTKKPAPRARGLSTKAACQKTVAAGGPFFDALFEDAPGRPEGEPLPQEYLDRVHRLAPRFVKALRATAADARDPKVRTALNRYAANVQRYFVDSPDLAEVTPENSGWLLDLGALCEDSLG